MSARKTEGENISFLYTVIILSIEMNCHFLSARLFCKISSLLWRSTRATDLPREL